MTVTITDDPTDFSAVVAPSASDLVNVASIQVVAQKLANRTAGNKARVDMIAPGSGAAPGGVQLLSYVADVTALKTLTGANRTNRGICLVASGAQLFQYLSDLSSNNPPYDIQPNDTVGTWRAVGYGQWGVASGLAQLDSTARVAAAKVRNGIITENGGAFGTAGTSYATTTSTSYVDIGSATVAVANAAVNDVLHIHASMEFAAGSAGAFVALVVADTAPSTNVVQAVGIAANTQLVVPFTGRYLVTQAGTQTVKLQFKSNTSGTQTAYGQIGITAQLIRP